MLWACGCKKSTPVVSSDTEADYTQVSPAFDADSAYHYVQQQVDFGARIPNSPAHKACGDYLVAQLKTFGAAVSEQKTILTAYDGTKINARNIIGSFLPDKQERVLLFAHWDSRPFSDHDANPDKHREPVLGANDGASGVGVLLEIARQLGKLSPQIGIDIIFFDAEDYGEATFAQDIPDGDWWCLGSQYWGKNTHVAGYQARFGILLDMVGAPDATFYKEGISREYAPYVIEKVWRTAHRLGYGKYFVDANGGYITDDHLYVNKFAKVPSIDIIQQDANTRTGFGHYWHTTKDDMSNISKETLKAVGQTVMEVVYKEK